MQRTDIVFWDTSAIVLLFASFQRQSQNVAPQVSAPHDLVGVEVHSALNRLAQEGKLTGKAHTAALNLWQGLEAGARIVNPVDRVCAIARALPRAYGLRALDSFQLAAALVWCQAACAPL